VSATEAGARALAAGETAGDEFLRRIFGRLGPDRLAAVDEVLAVIDAASAEASRPEGGPRATRRSRSGPAAE
jgi:hypothetical protein